MNSGCPWRNLAGLCGISLPGGGGVDRAFRPDAPAKRAQLMGPPKTDPGTSMVPMTVVFVLKDTMPLANSSYTCMQCPTIADH